MHIALVTLLVNCVLGLGGLCCATNVFDALSRVLSAVSVAQHGPALSGTEQLLCVVVTACREKNIVKQHHARSTLTLKYYFI